MNPPWLIFKNCYIPYGQFLVCGHVFVSFYLFILYYFFDVLLTGHTGHVFWTGVDVFFPVCWASGQHNRGHSHSCTICVCVCVLISFCGPVYLLSKMCIFSVIPSPGFVRKLILPWSVSQVRCISSIKLQVAILLSRRPLLSSSMACSTLVKFLFLSTALTCYNSGANVQMQRVEFCAVRPPSGSLDS